MVYNTVCRILKNGVFGGLCQYLEWEQPLFIYLYTNTIPPSVDSRYYTLYMTYDMTDTTKMTIRQNVDFSNVLGSRDITILLFVEASPSIIVVPAPCVRLCNSSNVTAAW